MEFKPYEEYKKIDLPWLNKIPSHWDIERNKNFLTVMNETVGDNEKDYKLLSLTKKGIIERDMKNPKGKFPSSFETYKIVEKNDIIFCLFDMDETPRTVGLSRLDGMITGAYNIFSIDKINRNYYYYYYLYLDKLKMLKPLYTGLRKTINEDAFLRLRTPFPPKKEQDKIAKFLDYNLEKIDRFIELREKQIRLLEEQKEVIINDAVTKGVNENVEYKDSGIESIGEIPEHWEIIRLKYLVDSNLYSLSNNEDSEKEIEYIDIGSVGFFELKEQPIRYKFRNSPTRARRIVNEKDIIISTVRTYLKSMLYINSELDKKVVSTGFSVLTPKEEINSKYLKYSLSGNYFIENVILNSTGVAYPAITDNVLISLIVIYCNDKNEQEQIVGYIERETSKIDKTIELYKKEISLIKEYKTGLIANAVTGKIDVRDFRLN